jgi:hypothetical protein
MITFTEFFLFIGMMVAIGYALYWRGESRKRHYLFKLMLEDKEIREQIVCNFEEFRRRAQ